MFCICVESHFVWQAQCFRDVFRRCIAVFVAGQALWTCPSSVCVAGAALQTCRVACFLQIAMSGLRQVATNPDDLGFHINKKLVFMDVPFIYIVFNRRFDPSPAGLMVQGFQQLDMMSCFCPILFWSLPSFD